MGPVKEQGINAVESIMGATTAPSFEFLRIHIVVVFLDCESHNLTKYFLYIITFNLRQREILEYRFLAKMVGHRGHIMPTF